MLSAAVPGVAVRGPAGAVSAAAVAGASKAESRVVLDRPSCMSAEDCCMLSWKHRPRRLPLLNSLISATSYSDCWLKWKWQHGRVKQETARGNMTQHAQLVSP
jgi:hypothetical protein